MLLLPVDHREVEAPRHLVPAGADALFESIGPGGERVGRLVMCHDQVPFGAASSGSNAPVPPQVELSTWGRYVGTHVPGAPPSTNPGAYVGYGTSTS